ncbi:MAG: hypothetical protein ACRDL4_21610, partial [Thermoleophilaceae bacterium]
DLAEHGHAVTALDSDGALLEELGRRARRRGLALETVRCDARRRASFGRFALVLAPMQFLQVLGGAPARASVLEAAAGSLVPGGRFAAALAALQGDPWRGTLRGDEAVAPQDALPPLPDVGERDGWVFSSLPLDVRPDPGGGVAVERLRQRISPAGELSEERHTQRLDPLTPELLEREAAAAGLRPEARHEIAATPDHVGSTVVVCRR